MKRLRNIMALWLIVSGLTRAGRATVSGYVVDENTGETIIGVNVIVRNTSRGTATDGNGYFVLTALPSGRYDLDFVHIAYEKKSIPVNLTDKNCILPEVALVPKIIEMRELSIVADKSELADLMLETGHRTITSEAIRRIPTGGKDVFRAIKTLPGIEGIDPISPLYVVRGSDPGENLILLDGVPIYNPYHFVGASGLFNVYALKNVELMVGGFGAEYGGRNSSVLYVTTREGNNKKLHGEISPGTSGSNAVVDFPIGRNATMLISGRYFYSLPSYFLFGSPNYFYDMNSTLTWKLSNRILLNVRGFHSYDDMLFRSETYFNYLRNTFDMDFLDDYEFAMKTRWRNQAVSGCLKAVVSPNIYWQVQVYHSAFSADNLSMIDFTYLDESDNVRLFMRTDIQAKIRDTGVHSKLDIRVGRWNQIKIGGEWNRYRFANDIQLNGYSEGKFLDNPGMTAGYCEDKIDLGLISFRPGIRFSRMGGDWQPEYRLNASMVLADRVKLKAAHGQYIQRIVSINTQEYEISQYLDTYFPLGTMQPSASDQTMIGLEADVTPSIQASLDLYYKDIRRTYAYDYNASQTEAGTFLEKLRPGRGEAFGLELLVKGSLGRTSGWVSYAWSRSTRIYPFIMNGKSHVFDYDRPHAFKAMLNHRVNPVIEFSGALSIRSGMPKTRNTGYATYFYYDPVQNAVSVWPQVVTPVKNNIRMPFLLNLDLSVKKQLRKGFGADLARYLGADKAYANITLSDFLYPLHRNVWFYIQDDETSYGVGTNYFPMISAGYSIQF